MNALKELCIEQSESIYTALKKIDKNAQGILFVVENEFLKGVVTDGDIRRALIDEKSIDTPVADVYNCNYISLHHNAKSDVIQSCLSDKIKVIPLIDEQGKVVDFASIYRLHRTPVLEPLLGGNELEYVSDCIQTNWISSQGKYVKKFEETIKKYTGSEYVLAVSNGTVALHLALVSLGIGPGDEVIVPDITFGATLNAVILTGANPVIVDVNSSDWNLSVELLKKHITPNTKAIMPVHIYGIPCNMPEIINLATKYKLLVIEDCAEALGASINTQHVGTFGNAGTFSFFGNKVITCGEGGAVIFKTEEDYEKAKILRDHGMTPGKRYWHEVVGFNYRLTNLQAAVGCAQFEQLDGFRVKRKKIFHWYEKYLLSSGYFDVQDVHEGYNPSYWLFTAILKDNSYIDRDKLIDKLAKLGIDSRPVFYPMSHMPAFSKFSTHLTGVADNISSRGISLPTSVYLTEDEIVKISKEVIGCIDSHLQLMKAGQYA